ncbi:MAG: hypothetical protein H6668_18330 [Ardenticatenaceae bacterium]|nr:hypothetical protein [Ardenticatenaceae bacterium]
MNWPMHRFQNTARTGVAAQATLRQLRQSACSADGHICVIAVQQRRQQYQLVATNARTGHCVTNQQLFWDFLAVMLISTAAGWAWALTIWGL